MALRTGHGNGKGTPRVEVLPVDEQPVGVPDCADDASRSASEERGKFTEGNRRSVLGGRASAGQCRLAHKLSLGESFADPRFEAYARSAKVWRNAQLRQLAATVGGGFVGPGPSSVIASAALQLAASRFAFEVLGDLVTGSRLANDSRQNLLAAHELCAREAKSRQRDQDPHTAASETFGAPALPPPACLATFSTPAGASKSENASEGDSVAAIEVPR